MKPLRSLRVFLVLILLLAVIGTGASATERARSPWDEIVVTQDPSGRDLVNYGEYVARAGVPGPLTISRVSEVGRWPSASGTILVIVNAMIQPSIQPALNQYAADLAAAGYTVTTSAASGGTPAGLRAFIQSQSTGLVGVVLVGDLPVPWFEIGYDYPNNATYADFPCDLFYMDLDGTWADNQSAPPYQAGVYDDHTDGTGDRAPDVWVSRLTASPLTLQGSLEVTLLNRYFTKNHAFRQGTLYTGQRALVYVDDDWAPWTSDWDAGVSPAYGERVCVSDSAQTCRDDYRDLRFVESYEWMHVMLHSSSWEHFFKVNGVWEENPPGTYLTVTSQDVKNADPVAIFYNLFCCYGSRFTDPNYLGGWYNFTQTHGLGAVGTTKTGGMYFIDDFYTPLGQGTSIGESFREWLEARAPYDQEAVRRYYGMTVLGDGSLCLRPQIVAEVPTMNDPAATPNTPIAITFDRDMLASTFSANSIRVDGLRSGPHPGTGTYHPGTRTYTFQPTTEFMDGEQVMATLAHAVNSDDNVPTRSWSWTSWMGVGNPTEGSYGLYSQWYLAYGENPSALVSADFNGDGYPDLAALCTGSGSTPGKLWVGLNDQSWGFSSASHSLSGIWDQDLVAADLDGDGDIDLAAGSHQPLAYIDVYRNNGLGQFTVRNTYTVSYSPGPISVGDYDGDGDLDLAFCQRGGGTWQLLHHFVNNGSGWFTDYQTTYTSAIAYGMSVNEAADVDGDGDLDLVGLTTGNPGVADDNFVTLFNAGDGTFSTPALYPILDTPQELCSGDFDGDGDLDVAVASIYPDAMYVIFNDGSGGVASHQSYSGTGQFCYEIVTADVEGDGDLDLALTNGSGTGNVRVYRNDGSGGFASVTSYAVTRATQLIDTDLDQDGDNDLAITCRTDGRIRFLRNDGSTDVVPPARVADLAVATSRDTSATVGWTAPGDDGVLGRASQYDLRYSTTQVGTDTLSWWSSATQATTEPTPSLAGTPESCTVSGLTTGQVYYFILKTADDVPNWSGYSNVAPSAAPQWVDVATGPLASGDDGVGVAWDDFDQDGDLDLYLANFGQANKLFRCEGGDVFVDVTSGPLGDTGSNQGVAWGDYDNDGDRDLYVANSSGANRLLRNDGAGTFVNVTSGPLGDIYWSTAVAWSDFDRDGDLDLYVANHSPNRLLRNDGGGNFVDVTSGPLGDASNTQGIAWGDYDGDGDADLYLSNTGATANKLIRNDGGGTFVDVTSGPLGDTGSGQGVAWGDYDNDGDLDLYLANHDSANRLLRNDGGGTFADVTSGPLGNTNSGRGVAWADMDNDGDLDLYVANHGQANRLFRNDGGGTFVDDTRGALADAGTGMGVTAGDYDGDGDLDLYLANWGSANRLFRNDLPTGRRSANWLHVDLVGAMGSNRDGIGARIRAVAGGASQIREVSGGSGLCSQNSLTAEFGFGTATTVDTLEIYWPSGIVDRFTALPAGQVVNAIEGATVDAPESPEALPVAYALRANVPNPFNPSTVIHYELPERTPVALRVYDLGGRVIRTLVGPVTMRPGRYHVMWDGRDAWGRSVGSGVYFYRMEAGSHVESRRMTLLR